MYHEYYLYIHFCDSRAGCTYDEAMRRALARPKQEKINYMDTPHLHLVPKKETTFLNTCFRSDDGCSRRTPPSLEHCPAFIIHAASILRPHPLPRCQRNPAIPSHPVLSNLLSPSPSLHILYPLDVPTPEQGVIWCLLLFLTSRTDCII